MSPKLLKNSFPFLTILATLLLFFYPLIFSGKTVFFRDLHPYFYPVKFFLTSSFQNGTFPFWCPFNYCGEPFMSIATTGVLYPLSLLFLCFPLPFSLNFFIILHFLLGFCFFYLFITSLGISKHGAVIAGISYCFGSYIISSVNVMTHLTTAIWLPALLWSYRQTLLKNNPGYAFLSVVFLSMAILGGAPQLVMMIVGLLFMCTFLWGHEISAGTRKTFGYLALIPILLATAIALTMVQLGPMYIDYLNSIRLSGISFEEATKFSLEPGMLKHLVVPLIFPDNFITNPAMLTSFFPGSQGVPWMLTVYPGVLILPLALTGLIIGFSKNRVFWLILFLSGILFSLGNNTPFFSVFYKFFPAFRFPVKFMFLASFSLLVMAAYGYDSLASLSRRKGIPPTYIFSIVLLLLIADLYYAHRHLNPVCSAAFFRYRHPDLDAVIADTGLHRVHVDTTASDTPDRPNTIQSTHIQRQLYGTPNLGVLNNISTVGGITGLELIYQYFNTELLMKPWPEKINFLRLSNVKYIVSTTRLDKIPAMEGQLEPVNATVYKIKNPMPRAWIVGQLQPVVKEVREELSKPSFDMRQTALTWGRIVEKYPSPYFKAVDSLAYLSSNTILIKATVDKPGILVLAESAYPGWRVTVDGVEQRCLKLNYLFQGVELDKGNHQIKFSYRPKYFSVFLSVSLGSLLLFSLSWASCGYLCRKKKAPP